MQGLPNILGDNESKPETIIQGKFIDESLINYFAAFPKEEELQRLLSEAFVINRPMSGVGGDGYWLHKNEDHLFIVVFDCMGHGRLASMMTRIYLSSIKNAIAEKAIPDPALILHHIHEDLREIFKNKNEVMIGSGADVAVVKYYFNATSPKIEYAGAKMDLVISKENEVNRIKANKRQVGYLFDYERVYETHVIEIPKSNNTKIYLYSDGITDLIGSHENKKFTYANLEKLLQEVCNLPMPEQKKLIEKRLVDWLGYNLPNDDLLMLGFVV